MDRRTWWATVHGVTKNLMRLSTHILDISLISFREKKKKYIYIYIYIYIKTHTHIYIYFKNSLTVSDTYVPPQVLISGHHHASLGHDGL